MNLAQTGGVVDRQRGAGVPTSVAQLGSAGQAIADEKKLARLAPGCAIIFAAHSEKEWVRAIRLAQKYPLDQAPVQPAA